MLDGKIPTKPKNNGLDIQIKTLTIIQKGLEYLLDEQIEVDETSARKLTGEELIEGLAEYLKYVIENLERKKK